MRIWIHETAWKEHDDILYLISKKPRRLIVYENWICIDSNI